MRLYSAANSPSNWRVLSVDELCTRVTSGGTPSRRVATYYGGDVPWVKTQELADGTIYQTDESLTEAGLANSSAKLLPTHTVLMAMYGATVGKLAVLAGPMTCNQAACALIVDPDVADYRYLFYQLLRARSQIIDLANGAAQQNLSAATIRDLEVPVPPLSEQRGIAATLGALDDKIESNRRAIEAIWDLLHAEYDQLAIVGDEVGLGDVLRLEYGKSLPSVSRIKGNVPVYGSNGVTGMHSISLIDGPAVIVGRKGSIGEVHWSHEPSFPIDTTFYVVPRDYPLLAAYFALQDADLKSKNSDSAIPGLNRDAAHGTRVIAPSAESAAVWSVERTSFLIKLHQLDREGMLLVSLRNTLLPELLSGRIRVPEAREAVEAAV